MFAGSFYQIKAQFQQKKIEAMNPTVSTTTITPLTYEDICQVFEQMQKSAPQQVENKYSSTLIGRAMPEITKLEIEGSNFAYSRLIAGMAIPISDSYIEKSNIQFRFPKSKRKRIRNKWAKNPKNYKIISEKKYHRCVMMQPI